MWVDPIVPVTVQEAETVVFKMDKTVDIPAGTFTDDSMFKYYTTDAQVNTQNIHLNFDLQSGMTGSDWTSVKEFAREIAKSTLPVSREKPYPSGIQGTFAFPLSDATHYRVVMKTFGGDSTGSFSMVVGLSDTYLSNMSY
jgi:hypothetical protein